MKHMTFSVVMGLLCSVYAMTAYSQDAVPAVLDSPATHAKLVEARELAGDDEYLRITQLLQCRDTAENGAPTAPGGDGSMVEAIQLFDNLYFVGTGSVGSFIITTDAGYVMIDAGWGDYPWKVIEPGMEKLGLDPALVQYILITHAGPDHAGGTRYFQEKYGTRIVMSQQEWDAGANPQPGSWQSGEPINGLPVEYHQWLGFPKLDMVATDGQTLTLGESTITMVFSPRRVNGGGFSYIFPVTDNGVDHMFSTYGNTNIVGELADKYLYREAVARFIDYTKTAGADVIISNHPFVDGSIMRMAELKDRQPGQPHPFVIGQENVQRFNAILDQCAVVAISRHEEGLDFTGTQRL